MHVAIHFTSPIGFCFSFDGIACVHAPIGMFVRVCAWGGVIKDVEVLMYHLEEEATTKRAVLKIARLYAYVHRVDEVSM